ncbi:hypothetical protein MANY_32090 [Mycolicibacterium anyangense]|uniref:Uncharacterized protein n=1 Tax=Mycolicibacterium anyangense TaxID=1431246 RepID=A0A6N4WD29_9MYCO|nr:hypothetical protein MANY_32090 [Mycolicibacterium anyangense]
MRDGSAAGIGDRGDGRFDGNGVAAVDHHTGTALGERGRDGRTDPARPSGDHDTETGERPVTHRQSEPGT